MVLQKGKISCSSYNTFREAANLIFLAPWSSQATVAHMNYLYGANMIDEFCPPNPNELDKAALISILSFFEPTSNLVS